MKKKIVALCVAVVMVCSICSCGETDKKDDKNVNSGIENEENNDYDSVSEAELESVEYWINKTENADEVIMTYEEISKYNDHLLSSLGKDLTNGYYDI